MQRLTQKCNQFFDISNFSSDNSSAKRIYAIVRYLSVVVIITPAVIVIGIMYKTKELHTKYRFFAINLLVPNIIHILNESDKNIALVGHEVARLPEAHCELNPIEMAWSQVKG